MKAVRKKSDAVLHYISSTQNIELRDDGSYLDGVFFGPAFTPADYEIVEFDPGDQLVFDGTHTYQNGVLAVVDAVEYQKTKRLYGQQELALRDELLKFSDWTQMPDCNHPKKAEWAVYRQALRDIPQQPGFPRNIQWPTKPE